MLSVVNPDLFAGEHQGGAEGLALIADSPYPYLAFALGAGFVCLVASLLRVARPPQPKRRRDEAIIDDKVELIKRRLKWPFLLFDPRRRKRMMGSLWNVIAVKEMRTKAFGRVSWVFRAMYISVVVSLLLAFLPLTQLAYMDTSIIILVCVTLPLGLILLVSPVLTSSAISEERESGVFEALRLTRLSAFGIVIGKLEVAWFFILLLLSSTFPTFFMLAYLSAPPEQMNRINDGFKALRGGDPAGMVAQFAQVDYTIFAGIGKAFAVAGVSIAFATVVGIWASSFFRKSSAATSVAYGVVLTIAVGTLVPYFMAESLPLWLVEWFVTLNPFAAAGKAASGQVFTALRPDLWLRHIYWVGGLSAALFAVTVARVHLLMRPAR